MIGMSSKPTPARLSGEALGRELTRAVEAHLER